ncbi:MAG: sulfite exporter TauE/SafE family protein [Deltaproteobacteria bacterium]|nr:sulfite exporter TauE/SafE family protein [Deltaproteobacteria bacterium]
MWPLVWLVPLGFVVGAFSTVVGVGGGFILVPILLFLYPEENPAIITSIGLAVNFCTATAGSITYARMGRVDFRSGLLLAAVSLPGAMVGAYVTDFIPRRSFDGMFGVVLVLVAVLLFLSRENGRGGLPTAARPGTVMRRVVEKDGTVHQYSYNARVGAPMSFVIGFVSAIFGLGGGVVQVPAMVRFLNFPVHVATATSHLMVALMSLSATLVHFSTGSFTHGFRRTAMLAIGVLLGAPLGARLSSKVKGGLILRALAVALAVVGLRLLVGSL